MDALAQDQNWTSAQLLADMQLVKRTPLLNLAHFCPQSLDLSTAEAKMLRRR